MLNQLFGTRLTKSKDWLFEAVNEESTVYNDATVIHKNYVHLNIQSLPAHLLLFNDKVVAMVSYWLLRYTGRVNCFSAVMQAVCKDQKHTSGSSWALFLKYWMIALSGDNERLDSSDIRVCSDTTPGAYEYILPLAFLDYFIGFEERLLAVSFQLTNEEEGVTKHLFATLHEQLPQRIKNSISFVPMGCVRGCGEYCCDLP